MSEVVVVVLMVVLVGLEMLVVVLEVVVQGLNW